LGAHIFFTVTGLKDFHQEALWRVNNFSGPQPGGKRENPLKRGIANGGRGSPGANAG